MLSFTSAIPGLMISAGRDLVHTGYGLASIGHVAETARHQ